MVSQCLHSLICCCLCKSVGLWCGLWLIIWLIDWIGVVYSPPLGCSSDDLFLCVFLCFVLLSVKRHIKRPTHHTAAPVLSLLPESDFFSIRFLFLFYEHVWTLCFSSFDLLTCHHLRLQTLDTMPHCYSVTPKTSFVRRGRTFRLSLNVMDSLLPSLYLSFCAHSCPQLCFCLMQVYIFTLFCSAIFKYTL